MVSYLNEWTYNMTINKAIPLGIANGSRVSIRAVMLYHTSPITEDGNKFTTDDLLSCWNGHRLPFLSRALKNTTTPPMSSTIHKTTTGGFPFSQSKQELVRSTNSAVLTFIFAHEDTITSAFALSDYGVQSRGLKTSYLTSINRLLAV